MIQTRLWDGKREVETVHKLKKVGSKYRRRYFYLSAHSLEMLGEGKQKNVIILIRSK